MLQYWLCYTLIDTLIHAVHQVFSTIKVLGKFDTSPPETLSQSLVAILIGLCA